MGDSHSPLDSWGQVFQVLSIFPAFMFLPTPPPRARTERRIIGIKDSSRTLVGYKGLSSTHTHTGFLFLFFHLLGKGPQSR